MTNAWIKNVIGLAAAAGSAGVVVAAATPR
jgi:hypothetical protein